MKQVARAELAKCRLIAHLVAVLALALVSVFLLIASTRHFKADARLQNERAAAETTLKLQRLASRIVVASLEKKALPETLAEVAAGSDLLDSWGTGIQYAIVQPQIGEIPLMSAGPDRESADDLILSNVSRK